MKGQSTLEFMLVFAGMLAFVSVIWVGSGPLREGVLSQLFVVQDEAAFEKLAWAVRAADFSLDGFSMVQKLNVAANASVAWGSDGLTWTALNHERTLSASFFSSGRVDLPSGVHVLSVKKNGGVALSWS